MRVKSDKDTIQLLIIQCHMFEYGFNLSPDYAEQPIGFLYHGFAGLHLISTMFLTKDDGETGPRYGVFYRILKPMGLEYLLVPIWKIMDSRVGKTTFGEYIRHSRNKLCTHGNLSFESLPPQIQALAFDASTNTEFQRLLEKLSQKILSLQHDLEKVVDDFGKAGSDPNKTPRK